MIILAEQGSRCDGNHVLANKLIHRLTDSKEISPRNVDRLCLIKIGKNIGNVLYSDSETKEFARCADLRTGSGGPNLPHARHERKPILGV